MFKQTVGHPYTGYYSDKKKMLSINTRNNLDQRHYAKWKSQSQKDTHSMIPVMKHSQKNKITEIETD